MPQGEHVRRGSGRASPLPPISREGPSDDVGFLDVHVTPGESLKILLRLMGFGKACSPSERRTTTAVVSSPCSDRDGQLPFVRLSDIVEWV